MNDSRTEFRIEGLAGSFGGMADLENEPAVDWLIKGWLARREISCLYGKGGTFKSYIGLGWSLQLAREEMGTLYIAAEGTSGLRSRVEAWMSKRRIAGQSFPSWHYYNSSIPIDMKGNRTYWLKGLKKYLGKKKIDLIIVDTLARNFAGDENSSKEMGEFVEGCEILKREFDAAVLVIHHTTNDGKKERGTETLRNATFAMFKTQNAGYSKTGGGSVDIVCDRMKDAIRPEPVKVKFDTVALDTDQHGEVHEVSQAMQIFPPKRKATPKTESKPKEKA